MDSELKLKIIEDIEFVLKSIDQEKEMSTDERTRIEMKTCSQILHETLETLEWS